MTFLIRYPDDDLTEYQIARLQAIFPGGEEDYFTRNVAFILAAE